jgi:quinol monooxygenase YgiN
MTLSLIAHIYANPDKIELVKNELLKLIPPTRKENGCINYNLHQDIENPAHFMFYENWESKELWQKHMNSEHIKNYIDVINELAERQTYRMQQVEL